MSEIAVITEEQVIGKYPMTELQKKIDNKTITTYDSVQNLINSDGNNKLRVIIIDMNKNFLKAKDYYANQGVKIAVCISTLSWEHLNELFSIGFDGYFFHGMAIDEIAKGINTMLHGDEYIHPQISEVVIQQPSGM